MTTKLIIDIKQLWHKNAQGRLRVGANEVVILRRDKMAKKQRRNPPSRRKYEENNPVVSFRVPKKDYDRFLVVREDLGMSHGDVYRAGLSVTEVNIRDEEEIKQQAYEEGQVCGYELAESVYKITYPCSICGKPIEVTTEEEEKAIRRFMIENRWHHGDCSEW